ncbi:MAG: hypothetical protein JWQ27_2138 [Ferruginibacter sp.]|nr:hypothetical protein [Ferruginibacter sp.]
MNPPELDDWFDSIINDWRTTIKLGKAASLENIFKTEQRIGFKFPDSFRLFYQKANGFENDDWLDSMISIWPLKRMEEELGRYQNFIGFSDYLINSHVYGFLTNRPGIFKNYDLAGTVPVKIAETFEEALMLIKNNSDLLY